MQGKIYLNIIHYKHELRFECKLQVFFVKNRLHFTHKSVEGQLKHWKNLMYNIYFM